MKTVKLSKQYVLGSVVFDAVAFREPLVKDLRQVGNPIDYQQGVVLVDRDIVWAYADRLLDPSIPSGAMGELELVDGLAIQRALLDFFTEAAAQLGRAASSSLASAGDQPMSQS